MNRAIVTMVSGNKPYSDLLKVFLVSLKMNGGDYKTIIYVFNGIEEFLNEIKILNSNVIIRNTKTNTITPAAMVYNRPKQMMDCLNEGYSQIASIDADVIFRSNIDGLWDGVVVDSIKFWDKGITLPIDEIIRTKKDIEHYLTKKKQRLNTRLQGGVFVVGNGDGIRKYWQKTIANAPERSDGYYFQRIMFDELELNKSINRVYLNPIYNDSFFNDSSVIWHGKTGCRKNKKWRFLFNKYLSIAENIIKEKGVCV